MNVADETTQRRGSKGLSHWQLRPAPSSGLMVVAEPAEAGADETVTYHASWDPNADQVEHYSQRFGLRCVSVRH